MKNVISQLFYTLIFTFYISILSAFPVVMARAPLRLFSPPETPLKISLKALVSQKRGSFGLGLFFGGLFFFYFGGWGWVVGWLLFWGFLPDIHTGPEEDPDLTFLSTTFSTPLHPAASVHRPGKHILNRAALQGLATSIILSHD